MKKTFRVFINGAAGTTGLSIYTRLSSRPDLSLITLPEELRKDPAAVREAMNHSDITFLCLPDEASRQAVGMLENPDTVVLDTSTAFRTDPDWVYGFPEVIENGFERVANARRIAVPGCHASGFIALVAPLVRRGFLSPDALLSCFSLTGYSGGGKKMIAQYEAEDRDRLLDAPRQYGVGQCHKHLAEMTAVCTLRTPPVFSPVVAPFYRGMEVTVPLHRSQLSCGADALRETYDRSYPGPVVRFARETGEDGFLSAGRFAGLDGMEISVLGNEDRMILTARYDNLGKGACGAAIECLNLVTGAPLTEGLVL